MTCDDNDWMTMDEAIIKINSSHWNSWGKKDILNKSWHAIATGDESSAVISCKMSGRRPAMGKTSYWGHASPIDSNKVGPPR